MCYITTSRKVEFPNSRRVAISFAGITSLHLPLSVFDMDHCPLLHHWTRRGEVKSIGTRLSCCEGYDIESSILFSKVFSKLVARKKVGN